MNGINIYYDNQVQNNEKYKDFKDILEGSDIFKENEEFHVLSKPLLIVDTEICTGSGVAIIQKGKKIVFLKNPSASEDDFDDFVFDFKALISELIGKYKYRSLLGKPSKVRSDITTFCEMDIEEYRNPETVEQLRLDGTKLEYAEIMSSLIKGSINDQQKINNLLSKQDFITKARNRIISFDTNQTKFIFPTNLENDTKREVVQGMAGSGKTEMLLHRLRTLYIDSDEEENENDTKIKIAFTCHNKVLANELRNTKITQFFNSMKIDSQILWNEKLFCFGAWGSARDKTSGMYSYICNFYDLNFYTWSGVGDFEIACKKSLEELKKKKYIEYAFDYVLIDESQDLPDSFFELCEKVTSKKVYVAGDVYQDIFDTNAVISKNPNYLLNRVYRTENKTFLFAHLFALGYFDKKIKWLDENDLNLCGYTVVDKSNKYQISRESLYVDENYREESYSCVVSDIENNIQKISNEIMQLKKDYSEITPNDIAVIILTSSHSKFQRYANKISREISEKTNFQTQVAKNGNKLIEDAVYISNQNHIKGLEYPFIFVLYDEGNLSFGTKQYLRLRTSFYMAATRSLIKSNLFFVDNPNYSEILTYSKSIQETGKVEVSIPTDDEIKRMNSMYEKIKYDEQSIPISNRIEVAINKYCSVDNNEIRIPNSNKVNMVETLTIKVQKSINENPTNDLEKLIVNEIENYLEYMGL